MKETLRKEIKHICTAIPIHQRRSWNHAIQQRFLALASVRNATVICMYYAVKHEVTTNILIQALLQNGKTICLPSVSYKDLVFRKITQPIQLQYSCLGIPEPGTSATAIHPSKIELIIVPLVAVNPNDGHRIGSGQGIYDRFFSKHPAPCRIGLAYEEQLTTTTFAQSHDFPLDIIITEQRIIVINPTINATQLMLGGPLATSVEANLRSETDHLPMKPHLAIVIVGHDKKSHMYAKLKKKACDRAGFLCTILKFEQDISEEILLEKIHNLNAAIDVSGIIIQLPLPPHLNSKKIVNTILPKKDVDGLTRHNRLLLTRGDESMACCAPKAIIYLLKHYGISLNKKSITLVGHGFLIGQPLAIMLKKRGATLTICDATTNDLISKTKTADIVIAATGIPKLISPKHIKSKAVVIDAGSATVNNKIVGDTDFEGLLPKVSFITPPKNGIGPLTVAMLLSNLYQAHKATLQTQQKKA